jgi:hypothetical protein
MKTFADYNDLKQVLLVAMFILSNEPAVRKKQGNLELNDFVSLL